MNRTALLSALREFIAKRPGLEFANYGDAQSYNAEARSILKDLHHARALLRYVEMRPSITAESIIEASKRAFSSRLTITPSTDGESFELDYCVGQYWPTEYRRAVCAVLSSAIWDWLRSNMPAADGLIKVNIGSGAFRREIEVENHGGMSAGDWIRKAARRELGRPLAARWFN